MDEEDEVFGINIKPKITPEEWFAQFTDTTSCSEALEIFANLKNTLDIQDDVKVYEKIKAKLTSWKCQSLWDLIDSKAKNVEYGKGTICSHLNVLVIGAGPIGLRTAIETALLGCRTVIVEKRTEFNRNNVLHLWPFLLSDFRSLGAKKFYGKFCAGAIDHISIRKLQSILLKVCLILGVEIYTGVEFKKLLEPTDEHGWRAQFSPYKERLDKFVFDIVVGADGKKDMLPGFPQIEMRGALAIGITCNFVNENTMAEAGVEEISGVAYQYNPKFFDELYEQFGVRLENIVYYKDETHYFVMTALKSSLLQQGVFKQDFPEPSKLLEKQNVDLDKLIQYALNTVHYATNYQLPSDLKLKQNDNGTPDIAVFDFTSLKKAANASRIMERKGKRLLLGLVGDSLLEPFWPTGSGCARGVLSSLDLAWVIRLYGMKMPPLAILRERENVFKLLSVTDSKDLQKNHKAFTINPSTRYSNLNQVQPFNVNYLKKLYDTDDPENADYTLPEPVISSRFEIGPSATMPPPRSKRKSVGRRRIHSASSNKRRSDRTTLREAKHVSKTAAMWEKRIPNAAPSGPPKRTKPSESGSGSCTLESVSESEEATGPYQRAMTLRKRTQNDEVSNVFTDSSAEELETFEDESSKPLYRAPRTATVPGANKVVNEQPVIATRNDDEKKGHRFGAIRKLLGKGRGDHGSERRKSIAARRSVSKARRLRRKSGTSGGQLNQLRPETEDVKKGSGPYTSVYKKERGATSSQDEASSQMPSERTLSAKALIAAAEARDLETVNKAGAAKKDLLKRKADAISDDAKAQSYENVPWSHCLPVVEPLLRQDNQNRNNEVPAVQEASQVAGLVLLAVPLLLPCRVRLVGKPSSMLNQKRNTLLRSSTEKRETKKISISRAGSVLRAVEQIQTKLEQETSTSKNENVRKNRLSGSFKRDSWHSSGQASPLLTQSTEEQQPPKLEMHVNTDEYDIIDMKSGPSQLKEHLRAEDDYDVISGSEVRFDMVDGEQRGRKMTKKKSVKQKPSEVLRSLLSHLCREQRLTSVQITLEILHGMHMSIARKPSQEKFYRIYTKGREFESYVWKKETCRQFLKQVGWQVCGSFIVLSRSKPIEEPLNCIQEAKREVEQLLKKQPQSSKERPSPNGVLNAASPNLEDKDIPLGKSLSPKDPKNKLKNSSGEAGIDSAVYKEDYIDLDESFNSTSSNEGTLESSEGYIGDENYLIVDFASAKSKENPASTLKGMEDPIYGKDGRRRRRAQEERELPPEDSVQTERVSLRQRIKQRGNERSTGIESERMSIAKNTTGPQTQGEVQGNKSAADDLYDERGRRRRSRRDRSTYDDPPADKATSRGSGMNQLAARETTTTPTITTDKSERQLDEVQKSLATKHTMSVEKNYLSPGDTIMAEDDITQDSSIAVKSNRVGGFQRESTDSSGSDTGKKKKLVLKRGSMRRKKILEEEKIVEATESLDSNMKSGVKQISGVTTDSSVTDKINEDNSEPCQQSEAKVNINISERIEKINANFLKEESTKKPSKSEEMNGEAVDGAISIKSRIANLMANMNSVEGSKEKAASESGPANDNILNHKPEAARDHVKSSEDNRVVKDDGKEGKGEKKRKLVLKVKRKKNHKLNENNKETIETSPAESCDSKHIDSTGKEEVVTRSMGGENEPRGKEIEHKAREESNREDNEQHSNRNQRITNWTRESPKVQRDIPKREIKAVKVENTLAEKEIKFESNGHSNGRNETKVALDYSCTENKNSINYKQEKNNGVIEINDAQGSIAKVAEDAAKPKKKKLVLKKKKK